MKRSFGQRMSLEVSIESVTLLEVSGRRDHHLHTGNYGAEYDLTVLYSLFKVTCLLVASGSEPWVPKHEGYWNEPFSATAAFIRQISPNCR